jgi:hypothetical protein
VSLTEASQADKQQTFFFCNLSFTTTNMTWGGQRDQVDPSLIVKSSRVSQPSKRVQGLDYPEIVGNAVNRVKSGASSSKG